MKGVCVIKVGGSLFDLPDLRARLRRFVARSEAERVVLVPGGGMTADAIRALDRTHRLGEEAAHWLAIGALSVNARFLNVLLPEGVLISSLACASSSEARLPIIDPLPFFEADEVRAGRLPHGWNVTSDSLAVRAAVVLQADELVLLKSAACTGDNWSEASRTGIVDGYFPMALASAPSSLRVRIVNLRTPT